MRHFVPVALVLLAVLSRRCLAVEDTAADANLKTCSGGFVIDYFNFFVDISDFAEQDCDNFAEIGPTVQKVIEEIQGAIPEYKNELIQAKVCPNPEFVDPLGQQVRRSLLRARRRSGTYSFPGTGACRRCRTRPPPARLLEGGEDLMIHPFENRYLKRREESEESSSEESSSEELYVEPLADEEQIVVETPETMEEHVCNMRDTVTADMVVAETAVIAAERKLQELLEYAVKPETTELVEAKEIEKHVKEAEKKLKDCYEAKKMARARAHYVMHTCDTVDSVIVETDEDEQGFRTIVDDLQHDTEKDAKDAQQDFYKVKDEKIDLKKAVVGAKFAKISAKMRAEEAELKKEVDVAVLGVKAKMKEVEGKARIAKSMRDKAQEEELESQKKTLEDEEEKLENDFEELVRLRKAKVQKDFEFEMGKIELEAANSLGDYMEVFADMVGPALEERLALGFSACFNRDPSVDVQVEVLESKNEMISAMDCPSAEEGME